MKLRTSLVPAAVVVLAASAAGCTGGTDDVVATEDVAVRVMQFNIEYGGTVVDFAGVPAAVEAADADVVAVQEAYGNTCRIARALDWQYCDPRTQTVSRYPLVTPADPAGPEVLVAVEPGRVLAVVNVHLPSAPYGPNRAAAGASADELVAAERGRMAALEPAVAATERLEELGLPVLVIGDFNTPSHRDWTEETAGLRDHVIPVEWPVTLAAEQAGLVDVYRAAHPDPVADEGLTWPAARPKAGSYNPALSGRPADRIDMTFASPDITVRSVEIVGEPGADVTDIVVEPWPSDHRAVVSELAVPLGDPGPYVSPVQRLVDAGAGTELLVSATPPPREVRVTGPGGELALPAADGSGAVTLSTRGLRPGEYTVTMVGASGTAVATNRLWVRRPGVLPRLRTGRATYAVGEPVEVAWRDAPGNKWDWLGVYRRGADPDVAYYKNWAYTEATVAGSASIGSGWEGGPWPLPPGEYDVLLLADDSYQELARAAFTVRR